MFYVTSKDLPTIATADSMNQAYTFRNMLISLGCQASVIKVEEESDV